MLKIGLVFEGGGGKGAYQIGVWKAIRELGIEPYVTCVSGTSVGALNAAMFYNGMFCEAEDIWRNITDDDILHTKNDDSFYNGDSLFSQKKLARLVETTIKQPKKNLNCKACYVTCRYRDRLEHRYFRWSDFLDFELKSKVLLASTAIPIIFESINIDGEWYVDGGANGDNTPFTPLLRENIDLLIIIHLSQTSPKCGEYGGQVVEIYPSENLGNLLTGTLDFNNELIVYRMNLGYRDAYPVLYKLVETCDLESLLHKKQHQPKARHTPRRAVKESQHDNIETDINRVEDRNMAEFKFSNEEARKAYESKVADLQGILKDNKIDESFLWDVTVQKYANKISKVNRLLQTEGIKGFVTSKMFRDMDHFLKRCSDAEFHIALVGAIKAGKSTLINALLGYEYASTKVTPETAALTKFKKGSVSGVKVLFYSHDEWDLLWKSANESKATVFLEEYSKIGAENEKEKWLSREELVVTCDNKERLVEEIQKWTSSKSECHYFVKEVEVSLAEFDLPEGVVLVDTPGLDDVVEYRSNITRDYIDRANAVLVCVKSDALTGQEMATIYSVFANTRYNPEKVYIIATQIDTLNRPKENWLEQREEWLKYLKGSGAFGSQDLAKRNLVEVSAYLFTLLNQYNDIKEGDDRYWDLTSILGKFRVKDVNEKYQELLDFTNIALLRSKMRTEIVQNHKKLLIDDIVGSYNICKESIQEAMAKIRKEQQEVIKASEGGIEEIKKKKAEYDAKQQEAEKDKRELDDLLKRLKMITTKRADELEKAISSLA